MIKAAVIGHPVSHSLSPQIHNHWFKTYGIDGHYEAIDIEPSALQRRVKELNDQGYAGFNVTVPHKQKIMSLCDTLDETARAIGAVNTVVIKDNKLEGRNTDAFGFIGNLKQAQPAVKLKNASALVLGAGGAARAIIYGLLQEGMSNITLANRTRENAQVLAKDFSNVTVIDWEDREDACADVSLLTNTTVLGMKGQDPLDMDISKLSSKAIVYDIVYKPLMTPLLQSAHAQNLRIVTGIGMLLHQARAGFAAWTGTMPDVTEELEKIVTESAR